MFSKDAACLTISMTVDCSKCLHTHTHKKKHYLFIFILLCGLMCMQSEKCPQMVLCTVILQ